MSKAHFLELPPGVGVAAEWHLTIHGIPRTKKTKNEIHLTVHKTRLRAWVRDLQTTPDSVLMRSILGRVKVQPGKLYRQWARLAVVQWEGGDVPELPIDVPVGICALIYRDRATGDAQGFYQAIGDYLEDQGILKNDRLIEHWDGSRRLKDKDHPRIELTISQEVSRGTPRVHPRRSQKDRGSHPPGYEGARGAQGTLPLEPTGADRSGAT